jgi:hypothetical protein
MNRLMKKLEDIMVAITFAEAGEFDTAIEMAGDKGTSVKGIHDSETDDRQTVVESA